MTHILFTIICLLLLSSCQLSSPDSTEITQDQTIEFDDASLGQFFQNANQPQQYQANIEYSENNTTQTYYVNTDTQGLVYTSSQTPEGSEEFIYTTDITYYRNATNSSWLQLPVDKINPAQEMAQFDIRQWGVNASQQESGLADQGMVTCGELQCHEFATTDSTGTTTIAFDTTQFVLRSVTIETDDSITHIKYSYDDIPITVPANAQPLSLPDDPTTTDIQQLDAIY